MASRCSTFQLPSPDCPPCDDFTAGFGESEASLLLRLDFRQAVIQPKPTLATWPASVPLPTRIYPLTEAGTPFSDGADGSQNFTSIVNPGNVLLQRTMLGLSADGSSMQSYTGIEFLRTAVTAEIQVGNGTYLDVGAAGSGQSYTVAVLFRRGFASALLRNIVRKRDGAAPFAGWSLSMVASGALQMLADPGAAAAVTATTVLGNYSDQSWHMAFGRIRRLGGVNELVEVWTELEGIIAADISTLGSLTNIDSFGLGTLAGGTNGSPENMQIPILIVWEDANSTALTQAHAQTLFRHATDPTGLLTTYTRAGMSCEQIGYETGHGALVGCFSGLSGAGRPAQVTLGYKAAFAHASRLGIRSNASVQNLIPFSDDFSNAAWVKTAITVGTAAGDLADGPGKFRNAQRLTAGGIGGSVQEDVATLAATRYTQSIYVRSLAANVAATLVQVNVTGGVDNASLAITVTSEWQRFDLTAITAAGQVTTGFRLVIPANAVVFGMVANLYLGFPTQLVRSSGAITTMPAVNIRALNATVGQWMKGRQGELLAYAVADVDDTGATRQTAMADGAADTNRRDLRLITGSLSRGAMYDSAGVVNHLITSGAFDHALPYEDRLLWRTPGPVLPSGFLSALLSNGVRVDGSAAAWAASDTVDTFYVGQDDAIGEHLGGLVALIESWNKPRAL